MEKDMYKYIYIYIVIYVFIVLFVYIYIYIHVCMYIYIYVKETREDAPARPASGRSQEGPRKRKPLIIKHLKNRNNKNTKNYKTTKENEKITKRTDVCLIGLFIHARTFFLGLLELRKKRRRSHGGIYLLFLGSNSGVKDSR